MLLSNSTVFHNSASSSAGGIGIWNVSRDRLNIYNSIIAGNIAPLHPDCSAPDTAINSKGYNFVQNTSGCSFTPATSDIIGQAIQLGSLLPTGVYFVPPTSQIVDTGNPILPGSGGYACEAEDQLGTIRPIDGNFDSNSQCDIGAYKSSAPNYSPMATTIDIISGNNQSVQFFTDFQPFSVIVRDQNGVPFPGATVVFTAPASGPSGSFSAPDTNSTTLVTDTSGTATTSIFTANNIPGSYVIEGSVEGISSPLIFQLENRDFWYVSTLGNNSNDCNSVTTPCATIQGALDKAASSDTIKISAETYYGTNTNIIVISKDITLIGGWDSSFTSREGMTKLDGQNNRRGIYIHSSSTLENVVIENFEIFNGKLYGSQSAGGGISVVNLYNLSIINGSIHNNYAIDFGGGIASNARNLTLINTTIGENSARYGGGIYYNGFGQLKCLIPPFTIIQQLSKAEVFVYIHRMKHPILEFKTQ